MNFRKTSILLFITSIFGIYAATHYFCPKTVSQGITVDLQSNIALKENNPLNSKSSYINWLNEEEITIWKELETTIHLTQFECQKKAEERSYEYKKEASAFQNSADYQINLSEDNFKIITSILKDFNIALDSILILPFDHFCPAAANDCVLLINETLFNKLTPAAKKFCIAHELQHFLYHDNSTFEIILAHCNITNKTDLPENHPVNKLSRFNEMRADLLAALKNDEYAQGFKEFIELTISIIGEGQGITHPKNTLRLTYAENILTIKT